jgi:hypothetical protein
MTSNAPADRVAGFACVVDERDHPLLELGVHASQREHPSGMSCASENATLRSSGNTTSPMAETWLAICTPKRPRS